MAARQGFEPWAPHGATVFDAARFGRSRTLPTITTIALVPATRKHGGGDEQHGQQTARTKPIHL